MEHTPLSRDALHALSALALAHVGDGVYSLMARTCLCYEGVLTARELHRWSVELVSAAAQAAAARRLQPLLTEGEAAVFARGRNAHAHAPRNVDPGDYVLATGLECLFGYLYLDGQTARLQTLFAAARPPME